MIPKELNLVPLMESRIKEVFHNNQDSHMIITRKFATIRKEGRAMHTCKRKDLTHGRCIAHAYRLEHVLRAQIKKNSLFFSDKDSYKSHPK